MKNTGIIDHALVSLFLQKEQTSLIKFGGYDKAALRDPDDFHVFRTIDKQTWALTAEDAKVMDQQLHSDADTKVKF